MGAVQTSSRSRPARSSSRPTRWCCASTAAARPYRDMFDSGHYVIEPGYFTAPYGAAKHFQARAVVPGSRNPETNFQASFIAIIGVTAPTREGLKVLKPIDRGRTGRRSPTTNAANTGTPSRRSTARHARGDRARRRRSQDGRRRRQPRRRAGEPRQERGGGAPLAGSARDRRAARRERAAQREEGPRRAERRHATRSGGPGGARRARRSATSSRCSSTDGPARRRAAAPPGVPCTCRRICTARPRPAPARSAERPGCSCSSGGVAARRPSTRACGPTPTCTCRRGTAISTCRSCTASG
jgi:hypothetical protein